MNAVDDLVAVFDECCRLQIDDDGLSAELHIDFERCLYGLDENLDCAELQRNLQQVLEAWLLDRGLVSLFIDRQALAQIESDLGQYLERMGEAGDGISAAARALARQSAVVARGIAPCQGLDAELRWFVETGLNPGQIGDDGRMDYRSRSYVKTVEKGTVLAELTEPMAGEAGTSVTGAVIAARDGESNIGLRVDERTVEVCRTQTGWQYIAACSGNLSLRGNELSIRDELLIAGDVDMSTGNIEAKGNVRIGGSVLAGFRVEATGRVEIGKDVQAGAWVSARTVDIAGVSNGIVEAKVDAFVGRVEASSVRVGRTLRAPYVAARSRIEAQVVECEQLHSSTVRAWREIRIERVESGPMGPSQLLMDHSPAFSRVYQEYRTELAAMEFELDWRIFQWRNKTDGSVPMGPEIRRMRRQCQQLRDHADALIGNKDGSIRVGWMAAGTELCLYGVPEFTDKTCANYLGRAAGSGVAV